MQRVCLAALVALSTSLNAQMDWVQFPATTGPAARAHRRLVFMEPMGKVICYGGYTTSELWAWDGVSWTLLDPSPPVGTRWGHGMSYDSRRGTMLVFGGGSGYWRDDTWEWDGVIWTEHRPATRPPSRNLMPMVYDERRGVHVVFGGRGPGNIPKNDTWEWDGTDWRPGPRGVGPSARVHHSMVFDPVRGHVVLFGGISNVGGTAYSDTWTYDGTAWTQQAPTNVPPARTMHGMVWDPHRARVVLHGGTSRRGHSSDTPLDDTWEWDGSDWTVRSPLTQPAPGGFTVYDPHRRVMVMTRGMPGETWFYFPRHAARAQVFGAGCAGDGGVGATSSLTAVDESGNLPWLGATFTTSMRNVPAGGQSMLVFGVSSQTWGGRSLPIGLGPYGGAPGCQLSVSPDLVLAMPAYTASQARLSFSIPNRPDLLGLDLHLQGLVVEASSSASRLAMTNRLALTFGAR